MHLDVNFKHVSVFYIHFQEKGHTHTHTNKFQGKKRNPSTIPICSMGRTVYLPINLVDVYGFHVGKYTVRPMEHMGLPHEIPQATIDGSEIRRSPVEGTVVFLPLFNMSFSTIPSGWEWHF